MKVLLLNNNYEVLGFISEIKAVGFVMKDKVDIISYWDYEFEISGRKWKHPSILKLKYYVKHRFKKISFSRKSVFRRDQYICQYCGDTLTNNEITIDHVVPKSAGGKSSFLNCVSSCLKCNSKKSNKMLKETGMKLLTEPYIPVYINFYSKEQKPWNPEWDFYVK